MLGTWTWGLWDALGMEDGSIEISRVLGTGDGDTDGGLGPGMGTGRKSVRGAQAAGDLMSWQCW